MTDELQQYHEQPFHVALGIRLKHFVLRFFSWKTWSVFIVLYAIRKNINDWKILLIFLLYCAVVFGIKEFIKIAKGFKDKLG